MIAVSPLPPSAPTPAHRTSRVWAGISRQMEVLPAIGSTRVDSLTRTEADTEHIKKKMKQKADDGVSSRLDGYSSSARSMWASDDVQVSVL